MPSTVHNHGHQNIKYVDKLMMYVLQIERDAALRYPEPEAGWDEDIDLPGELK